MSQLDLAVAADVSARHLSFVETGRSRPSRELVLHLAEHLDVPVRDRNALLLAAGYAPVLTEHALDDDALAPVRAAIDAILHSHEPLPALVVDRHWNIVAANDATLALLDGVSPELLGPPTNAMRLALHPDGLAPRIVNFDEWRAHLLQRLARQLAFTADPVIAALLEELRAYATLGPTQHAVAGDELFVPMKLRVGEQVLGFLSTISTFGTAVDVTVAELSIEQFFPADAATARALSAR